MLLYLYRYYIVLNLIWKRTKAHEIFDFRTKKTPKKKKNPGRQVIQMKIWDMHSTENLIL